MLWLEVAMYCENPVTVLQSKLHRIPDELNLHQRRFEKFNPQNIIWM
jgi:hypothetical protein